MGRLSTLLIRAGYSPLLAEEMDAYLVRFAPQEAHQVLAWSFDALSRMSYADYVREARIGWWDSAGVPFEFKRLLDSQDEGEAGKALAAARIIQADERHAALAVDEGGLLRHVAVAAARRAWADAYRDWERAPFNPDAPPEAPVHAGLKGLWAFYERFKPGDFDPSHPAHALRLHLEATKAWVEEDHPRHPAGTPVDPESGAGGGRFAPRETSGEVSPQGAHQPAWSSSMPTEQAEIWAAGSAIKDTLAHVTMEQNVESLKANGFDLSKKAWGRAWGDGVYVTGDAEVVDFYKESYERDGNAPAVLKIKINVEKVLDVRMDDMRWADNFWRAVSPATRQRFEDLSMEAFQEERSIFESAPYSGKTDLTPAQAGEREAYFDAAYAKAKWGRGDPTSAVLTYVLRELGYDAVRITQPGFTEEVGGSQVVIFNPQNVVILND